MRTDLETYLIFQLCLNTFQTKRFPKSVWNSFIVPKEFSTLLVELIKLSERVRLVYRDVCDISKYFCCLYEFKNYKRTLFDVQRKGQVLRVLSRVPELNQRIHCHCHQYHSTFSDSHQCNKRSCSLFILQCSHLLFACADRAQCGMKIFSQDRRKKEEIVHIKAICQLQELQIIKLWKCAVYQNCYSTS